MIQAAEMYWLRCDCCPAPARLTSPRHSREIAIRLGRQDGWMISRLGLCICPDCARQPCSLPLVEGET